MAGGEPKLVGVAPDGAMALPWLREPLTRALRLDRSHALLVHAPQDVGQLELALALAQAWLCEQPEHRPCGQCNACRLVRQRSHPDLRIVVPDALRLQFEWLLEDDPLLRAAAPSRAARSRSHNCARPSSGRSAARVLRAGAPW